MGPHRCQRPVAAQTRLSQCHRDLYYCSISFTYIVIDAGNRREVHPRFDFFGRRGAGIRVQGRGVRG